MNELTIAETLERLRHDENHHIGLGDIRLTIGQQEWMETRESSLLKRIAELERLVDDLNEQVILGLFPSERDAIKAEGIEEMLEELGYNGKFVGKDSKIRLSKVEAHITLLRSDDA